MFSVWARSKSCLSCLIERAKGIVFSVQLSRCDEEASSDGEKKTDLKDNAEGSCKVILSPLFPRMYILPVWVVYGREVMI